MIAKIKGHSIIDQVSILDSETPGTYRFRSDAANGAPIPMLYIRKDAFGKNAPKKIRIVIVEME